MSLPWFPMYANDFALSTATMSPACVGSYIRLLCYSWASGGIPNDYEVCARIAVGMTPTDWAEIRKRFELVIDPDTAVETLTNPRMERERQRTETIRRSRSAAAKKTNSERWIADRVGDRCGERVADRVADRVYPQSHTHTQQQRGKKHDAAAQLRRISRDSNT